VADRILYVQYTNPAGYPPLEHSSRILAGTGWQVLFLGTGAYGADNLRFPPHPNIRVRKMAFCPAGWRQKLHYLRFVLWVLAWALWWRPRCVYASDLLSCPVALVLRFLPGTRVIYHEHDSPIGPGGSAFLRLCMRARRRLARRTQACILPTQGRAAWFARDTGTDGEVRWVWNCPSLDELPARGPDGEGDGFWLVYHGSIGPSLVPLTVLQALALLPPSVKLRVTGYETIGHAGYRQALEQEARRLGIADRVEVRGPVPRFELLEKTRGDVGLALMPRWSEDVNYRYMAGASNKAFDYLACGLALLVSDLPDWREFFVKPGYGLACDPQDPAGIAAALRWYLEHPEESRAMGKRGRQRVRQEWNYERQFQPILDLLNGTACASHPVGSSSAKPPMRRAPVYPAEYPPSQGVGC
jgi:glycosyltransferase involved in cell wall biosynthesis